MSQNLSPDFGRDFPSLWHGHLGRDSILAVISQAPSLCHESQVPKTNKAESPPRRDKLENFWQNLEQFVGRCRCLLYKGLSSSRMMSRCAGKTCFRDRHRRFMVQAGGLLRDETMPNQVRVTKVLATLLASMTIGAIILMALGHNPPSAGPFR